MADKGDARAPIDSRTPLARTFWFEARAGAGAGASAARFGTALVDTRNVPPARQLQQRVIEEGLEVLRPHLGPDKAAAVLLVDANGVLRKEDVEELPRDKLTDRARGTAVRVRRLQAPWAFLGIPVPGVSPYEAGTLRLMLRADKAVTAVESSGFSAAAGLVVALITTPGAYQVSVMALSTHGPWTELGPTLDTASARGIGRVTQLDVHPSNGNIVIAAGAGGGVWRTDDGGLHWRPLMDDQPSLPIGAVAFAPSNPDVIYAASGEDASPYSPAWPGVGIYRSSNGGATWPVLTEVESKRFSEIAVHPWKSRIAYAAGNVGLHRTRNRGLTWRMLVSGRITSVVIDHDDPNRIYIGVYRKGVYRTKNGHTFSRLALEGGLSARDHGYIKLAIGRQGTPGTRFLIAKLGERGERIYTSTDGGDTWARGQDDVASSPIFTEWTSLVAVSPVDIKCLYAGQRFTLRRSDSGGAPWNPIDAAGPLGQSLHPDHQDLAFDPNDARHVYLANDAGVYVSPDKGATWRFASGDLNIAQLHDLDISEQNVEIVACGAQESGVHYRRSTGQWRTLDFQFDGTRVAIDPADPKIVYFSSQFGITKIFDQSPQPSLARTLDANTTAPVSLGTGTLRGRSPFVTVLTLDPDPGLRNPADNRIVFLAGHDGLIPHLFRSTDGGKTWKRIVYQNASPHGPAGTLFVPEGDVTALEFAPGNSQVLYLGTSLGAVYRATNRGIWAEDWTRIDDGSRFGVQVSAVAADPGDNQLWVVYAGDGVTFTDRPDGVAPSRTSHVYMTPDRGATWSDASGIFFWQLPDVPTSAVVVDDQALHPGRVYVGTDTGVFVTYDGGIMWFRLGAGLPNAPVSRLRLHRTGRWLFAATMGRGAFRYKLD